MFEKLVEILNEQLSLDGKDIKPESSFKDDLEVDSLDLFEALDLRGCFQQKIMAYIAHTFRGKLY